MYPKKFTLQRRAITLIKSEPTMVLSTLNKITETPWSAPVYFLYNSRSFYFLSSPKSRHILQAMKSKTAASIFSKTKHWSGIQGVQMLGNVSKVKSLYNTRNIIRKYFVKFDLTNNLLSNLQKNYDPLSCLFEKFSVKLYDFTPYEVVYTDNYFGLGFKKEINIIKKD